MKTAPMVSVVMPVYNAEHHMQDAIESILRQTFVDLELLIVDDGSTDDSLLIARSFADGRVRVLSEPHQGLVLALNRGIAEARGEYVARMDADDLSSPGRIERQVKFMMSRRDVVMVGTWCRLIDEMGKAIGTCRTGPTHGRQLRRALCAGSPFVHGSVLICRQALLTVGAYRSTFATAEDYDLWLRLAEVGVLANLPEVLYHLRVHQGSKTVTEGNQHLTDYTILAQQAAVQRYLFGHDDLDYTTPLHVAAPTDTTTLLTSVSEVAASDWAQVLLWQGRIRLCLYVLWLALRRRSARSNTWILIGPNYLSAWRMREWMLSARRALRRSTISQVGSMVAFESILSVLMEGQ